MNIVVAVLALVVAVLAVLVVSLLRSHAEILRTLHDLGHDLDPATRSSAGQGRPPQPVDAAGELVTSEGVPGSADALGRAAADVAGTTPGGDPVVIGISSGPPTLVAFLSSGCLTCHRFWEAFAGGADLPAGERLVVVTRGPEAESISAVAELTAGFGAEAPAVVLSTDTWEDYGVPVAPYFVLVEGGAVVGEGAAATWDQVRTLLGRARADADAAGGSAPAGRGSAARSRRSVLTGNRDRIDADLTAAGLRPGDPRLYEHGPADVGLAPLADGADPQDPGSRP